MKKKSPPDTPLSAEAEETLSLRQAADFIGVSSMRLNRLRREGKIPARQVGWRNWRFRSLDLMAYVERVAGVPEAALPPAAEAPNAAASDPQADFYTWLLTETPPPPVPEQTQAAEPPLVRLVNAILVTCFNAGASDIHIEPDRKNVRIRIRADGVMHQIMTLPKRFQAPVAARLKVMADIDPFKRAQPHRGNIPVKHGDKDYNLRVSVVPSQYGESFVIHVLDQASCKAGLPTLGFFPEDQQRLEGLTFSSSGLLLFAGPHGSGLTTTVFSLLNKRNAITIKIETLEETPEYLLGGIEQTFRLPHGKMTFGEGYAALLGHNPDILFLGDLCDAESAQAAVDAALSGVLVLATLPSLDSVDALRRLIAWGVEPDAAARAVIGVVAQRLVGKICEACKEAYVVPAYQLHSFGYMRDSPREDVTLYWGAGCEACQNRGLRGRIALYEVLGVSKPLAALLRSGAARQELLQEARATGYASLVEDGVKKMLQGITTPDYVQKAIGRLSES